MRLWHKDLIKYLPSQQLRGQWRKLHLIAKQIAEKGTPNHILVNPIMKYPSEHFYAYCWLVYHEMLLRGYSASMDKLTEDLKDCNVNFNNYIYRKDIFKDWHNDRYLNQCLMNLQEKYDRGGIKDEEWRKIYFRYFQPKVS